jgi:hypothetical protein
MRKLTGFAGALQVDCVQRSVAAGPRGKRDAVILIRPQRRTIARFRTRSERSRDDMREAR